MYIANKNYMNGDQALTLCLLTVRCIV